MRKKIEVKIDEKYFYSKVIEVLNPMFKLSPNEQKVLSALLSVTYKNVNLSKGKLKKLLLRADSKKAIRKAMKMSEASFNNIIAMLKKKRLIQKSGEHLILNPKVLLLPTDGEIEIVYKFIME